MGSSSHFHCVYSQAPTIGPMKPAIAWMEEDVPCTAPCEFLSA